MCAVRRCWRRCGARWRVRQRASCAASTCCRAAVRTRGSRWATSPRVSCTAAAIARCRSSRRSSRRQGWCWSVQSRWPARCTPSACVRRPAIPRSRDSGAGLAALPRTGTIAPLPVRPCRPARLTPAGATSPMPVPRHCAIDFGTSNSAVALPARDGIELVAVEGGFTGMPTAVFYAVEGLAAHHAPQRLYGRAAIGAYVEGTEGRLMRSMKSILGSDLVERSTDVGGGHSVRYLDVIGSYLRHLKARAEALAGAPIERAVIGRPVFFVDDEPERDAAAQASMAQVAREVGFADVQFQYEPIAAAFDHEQSVQREQTVLVADIGGGTSDFSVVRVGPERRARLDRRD